MTTKEELKKKAKEKGIKRYYEMTKPQLILALADSKNVTEILEKMKKKATCEHERLKIYCSTCCGKKFCVHKKRKDFARNVDQKSFVFMKDLNIFVKNAMENTSVYTNELNINVKNVLL